MIPPNGGGMSGKKKSGGGSRKVSDDEIKQMASWGALAVVGLLWIVPLVLHYNPGIEKNIQVFQMLKDYSDSFYLSLGNHLGIMLPSLIIAGVVMIKRKYHPFVVFPVLALFSYAFYFFMVEGTYAQVNIPADKLSQWTSILYLSF